MSRFVFDACFPLLVLTLGGRAAAAALARYRRQGDEDIQEERFQRGFCLSCGYDLRGGATTPCPECGPPSTPAARTRREADAEQPP